MLLPTVEKEVGELHDLGAPSGDEDTVEAMLVAMQQGVEADEKKQIPSLESFGQGFHKSDKLLHAYGLEACAFDVP